jgi:hypothetical protein
MRAALALLFGCLAALGACGREDAIAPDLAFNFTCHGAFDPPSESAMETFLTSHGFSAFNEERVRKQYHLRLYPLAIDGYDAHHRMLDFRGINEKPSDEANDAPVPIATIYSVGLYSPPPTVHDGKLETALVSFAKTVLKCDVLHFTRGNNAADRGDFYAKVYAAEQTRIRAGRACDRQSGKPLDSHCPS